MKQFDVRDWKKKMLLNEQKLREESDASKQAKKLGLTYYGFGRYGKDGETTHKSINGKLTKVPEDNFDYTTMQRIAAKIPGTKSHKKEKDFDKAYKDTLIYFRDMLKKDPDALPAGGLTADDIDDLLTMEK